MPYIVVQNFAFRALVTSSSFNRLDAAHIDWQPDQHWLLSLGLDNVFDERYRVHGSGLDAPGRNLSLSVRRDW